MLDFAKLTFVAYHFLMQIYDTNRIYNLMTDLYLSLSQYVLAFMARHVTDQMRTHDSEMFHDEHAREQRKMMRLEIEIRNALHKLSAHVITMPKEFGLLPVCTFRTLARLS
jgi:hypothetical protein